MLINAYLLKLGFVADCSGEQSSCSPEQADWFIEGQTIFERSTFSYKHVKFFSIVCALFTFYIMLESTHPVKYPLTTYAAVPPNGRTRTLAENGSNVSF